MTINMGDERNVYVVEYVSIGVLAASFVSLIYMNAARN